MNRALAILPLVVLAAACRDRGDAGRILVSGHVEATEIRIAAKIAGRIESFPAREGDTVKAGQEIARIETTDLVLALRQAEAERDLAGAELALRLAGSRKEDIAELEAQVASGRAERVGAQQDLDRMEALLQRGSGTPKARDDAVTRRDIAAAKVVAVEQALARARAGFRPEEIDAAQARQSAANARIAQIRQQVEDATVRSPVRGVVTEKVAEGGEIVAAGRPLAVVTVLSDVWLNVYVGEPDLPRIRIGQRASVRTDDGREHPGRVTFVASQAEFTPKNVQTREERVKLVFKVKIGLDNLDGLFKPGMPAEAVLEAASGSPP